MIIIGRLMGENSGSPENLTQRVAVHSTVRLERWGCYSVAINLLLAALHGIIASASGSLAVTAELIHNVVDFLSALAVLIGLRLATRKSEAFPYGLYKVENLTAAGLAVMIFISAFEIVSDALMSPATPVRAEGWMLALLLVTTAIPLLFSHFELRAARSANSPALLADAMEYRIHIFTTGLAFAALFSQWLNFPLDRIAALLIIVVVIKTGWDVLRDAMRVLLDASLDGETLRQIRQVIDASPAVSQLRWVTGRNAGRFRFVEAGVTLRVVELEKAEEMLQRIEAEVRAAVPHVERVLLHVESTPVTHLRYAVPLNDREGSVSMHFGEAPYFAMVTRRIADGEIEDQRIISNPHRAEEKGKGIRVAEWLVTQKIDAVLLQEDLHGKGPEYVMREAGVTMHLIDNPTLHEALSSLTRKTVTN